MGYSINKAIWACFLPLIITPCVTPSCHRSRTIIANSTWGVITDGPDNYTQDSHCEWLISAPKDHAITLKIDELRTECSFDYLFVFDGDSYSSSKKAFLLASFSGAVDPHVSLLAVSGHMLILLYSDTNYVLDGFRAEYSVTQCPLNCSNSGDCISSSTSLGNSYACQCLHGKSGPGCETDRSSDSPNDTPALIYSDSAQLSRVGHSIVNLEETAYIFGGFDLTNIHSSIISLHLAKEELQNIISLNFTPSARYGHASIGYKTGFFVHGGKTKYGISNELLYFNVSDKTWTQYDSSYLPHLMYHTMTVVRSGEIYVYGGGTELGAFSGKLYRFDPAVPGTWMQVRSTCCGKIKDRSVLGHTVMYWEDHEALLLYGGVAADVGRFSRLSNQMWMFFIQSQVWVNIDHRFSSGIPPGLNTERAFHTADVVGDYLVILGGYTHTHNRDETCYSSQMLVYNLQCQVFLPDAPRTEPFDGLFGHKTVRWQKQLYMIGGYRGYMVPLVKKISLPFSPHPPDCISYERWRCSGDPRCGWCPTDGKCYERIAGSKNCTTNLQTSQCPGLCPLMTTCQACVIGTTSKCFWCDSLEACFNDKEETRSCPSVKKNLTSCVLESGRQGVTLFEFKNPANYSQPDLVKIINSTALNIPKEANPQDGPTTVIVRGSLTGFIYPQKKLELCALQSAVNLTMQSPDENLFMPVSWTDYQSCINLTWPSGKPVLLLPDVPIQFELSANTSRLQSDKAGRVTLQQKYSGVSTQRVLRKDNLLPYSGNGSCSDYVTCLACLGDSACAWNRVDCISRKGTENELLSNLLSFILLPEECSSCGDYNFCTDCANDAGCEWGEEEASCTRRGRMSNAVKEISSCPSECHLRENCTTCLDFPGKCVWCEHKQECFVFSVYTSFYQYGQCQQWLDKPEQCHRCDKQPTCESCVLQLGCGWTYDENGGTCSEGDFSGPYSEFSSLLETEDANATQKTWTYADCPDVNECEAGTHECHVNATCENTLGSYYCRCNQGFTGDGRLSCEQTCFEPCFHGVCSLDFVCECDLGWTGVDCSIDCGCNNHSFCETGGCDECQGWTTGEHCESCKVGSFGNATLASVGCKECACHGHGNLSMGLCHPVTGFCYCLNNTAGRDCSECAVGFYGNPKDGSPCFRECSGRAVLEGNKGYFGLQENQQSRKRHTRGSVEHCLWIIRAPPPDVSINEGLKNERHIRITVSSDYHIPCSENGVMIYRELPWFGLSGREAPLVATLCREEGDTSQNEPIVIVVKGDVAVVLFQYAIIGASSKLHFNATYEQVISKDERPGSPVIKDLTVPVQKLYDGQSVLSRFGHSLHVDDKSIWIFGGYSLSNGPLNDVRHFSRELNKWIPVTITVIQSEDSDSVPVPRYFHGGTYGHNLAIYIHGGISHNLTFLSDTWRFDTRSSRWSKFCRDIPGPRLAGHTLTRRTQGHQMLLVVIGGFNPEKGFNNLVYTLTSSDCWEVINTTGSSPLGVYGHSTVYHGPTDSFFVFGGVLYEVDKVSTTSRLHSLHWPTKRWSVLPPSEDNQVLPLPFPKLFHNGVTTDKYMVLLGGIGSAANNSITVYVYQCNLWLALGKHPELSQSAAAAYGIGNEVILMGGWKKAITSEALFSIFLPKDICENFHSSEKCKATLGCSYCSSNNNQTQQCYSTELEMPEACSFGASNIEFWKGTMCSDSWISERNCNQYLSCTECLATWPAHPNASQVCQWCTNCPFGRCIPVGKKCQEEHACYHKQRETTDSTHCPERLCSATDCEKCTASSKCIWTRQILRSNDWSWKLHSQPVYDWNCVRKSILDTSSSFTVMSSPPDACPRPCSAHTNCSSCLESPGAEGGFHQCHWSVSLKRCISPAHSGLLCFGGLCGPILKGSPSICPKPCDAYTSCASCLEVPSCGWCATEGGNGEGRCLPGEQYAENGACPGMDWDYLSCPKENECTNGHHTCDHISEECIDLDGGYRCQCRTGYERSENSCIPICPDGCIHGTCSAPGECTCHFGFVGRNCSYQCKCNGHSLCAGVDQLDKCIDCRNNTMGPQCSKCKPLFVGDPKNNGACIPCFEYCNGHSTICLSQSKYSTWCNGTGRLRENDLFSLISSTGFEEGPSTTAFCCFCKNETSGDTCNDCLPGFFRGSEDKRRPCRKCECHGHGDTCDAITGHLCNCDNNTESEHCPASGSSKQVLVSPPCWTLQCSKCKDYYLGSPTHGHQCYRQMIVETQYCFDPTTQENCTIRPKPLLSGKTVFFAVQPKFMNVNIRINIDVTQGAANVFLSPKDDTFVVRQDGHSWMHHIEFDTKYGLTGDKPDGEVINPEVDNSPTTDTEDVFYATQRSFVGGLFRLVEHEAAGFTTYINLFEQKAILVVRNLRNRLVITLPQESHDLRLTRFYVVLQGVGDVSYGSVLFRQDQLHIDLFVFFSVFFSAFFLFLAACGIAWKVKQNVEARRARHRHVAEMLSMAKRPFAVWTVILEPESSCPLFPLYSQCRKTCRKGCICIRPLAVEVTKCGTYGICTMLVSLPGGSSASVRVCLGSTLANLSRSHPPLHSRRRRLQH